MIFRTIFTSAILCLSLSGCVFKSSPLSYVKSLFEHVENDSHVSSWKLSYNEYTSVVYPINVDQDIVFANNQGDYLLFDGWSIREVRMRGYHSPNRRIVDEANRRSFYLKNQVVDVHDCENWFDVVSTETNFYQNCEGSQRYTNSISVSQSGEIREIAQIIGSEYTFIYLTRL